MACFCEIYIYIPYFWWNEIHSLFFYWYIFLWILACLELFFFLEKEFNLSVFSVFSFKESIDFGTSKKNNTVKKNPTELTEWILIGKTMHFPCGNKVYHEMGIWWKKSICRLGKNGYQYPRLFQFDGFHCIFPCYGKLMGKPIYFTYYEVYHRMWKKHPYYGKSMSTNFPGFPQTVGFVGYFRETTSQTFPIQWVWLSLPMLWEINEKTHASPMWWSIPLGI